MIELSSCYHHGILVADLDAAMEELGVTMGASWCTPVEAPQQVWMPDRGEVTLPLRFTYSAQGPVHLELVQGAPGTIWDGVAHPGLHHMGMWCDDVASSTRALLDVGWHVVLAQAPPERGYGVFTYVRPPSGLVVELVSTVVRPAFERWWGGGTLF